MPSPRKDIFTEKEWRGLREELLDMSPRQLEITRELMRGASDKQISAKLGMSVWTLRTHLSRLFEKLDVQDRVELILLVFRKFRDQCNSLGCPRNK